MPIQKAKAFLTSDNAVFLTQEDAQKHEIAILEGANPESENPEHTAAWIMGHKDELLAILSTRKVRVPKVKPARVNAAKANRAAVNAALQDSKQ